MSPNQAHSSSNCQAGQDVRRANILASCYVVDSSLALKGLHYSTTGADGKSHFNSSQFRSLLIFSVGAKWLG